MILFVFLPQSVVVCQMIYILQIDFTSYDGLLVKSLSKGVNDGLMKHQSVCVDELVITIVVIVIRGDVNVKRTFK